MENREIKFRAWDGDEMFNDIYFTKANNRLIDLYKYNHNTLLKHITVIDKDHLIILQYTGLKDKKGKEIYVGDLVKRMKHISAITFKDGGFVWNNMENSYLPLGMYHNTLLLSVLIFEQFS